MRVVCNGVAKVKIKTTGEVIEITPDQLHWVSAREGEHENGSEIRHSAIVDVKNDAGDHHGQVTWSIWESTAGRETHKGHAAHGVEVEEDFDFRLEHEPGQSAA